MPTYLLSVRDAGTEPCGRQPRKEDVISSHSGPARSLPSRPSLTQLRKQAKELRESYRAGDDAAIAEVERFERSPDPANFALADAQRVLARAYGFSNWPALANHVVGVNFAALLAVAEAGDVAAMRRLARARPDDRLSTSQA